MPNETFTTACPPLLPSTPKLEKIFLVCTRVCWARELVKNSSARYVQILLWFRGPIFKSNGCSVVFVPLAPLLPAETLHLLNKLKMQTLCTSNQVPYLHWLQPPSLSEGWTQNNARSLDNDPSQRVFPTFY